MARTGYLSCRWYAKQNDVIGGWCVMPFDDTPAYGIMEVADFTNKEMAEHIARLHNDWLEAEQLQELKNDKSILNILYQVSIHLMILIFIVFAIWAFWFAD